MIGAGLGENARAALITRGLAELGRLPMALGGRAETVMGLSGLGDLLLTCTGPASRNFCLGLALGARRGAGRRAGRAQRGDRGGRDGAGPGRAGGRRRHADLRRGGRAAGRADHAGARRSRRCWRGRDGTSDATRRNALDRAMLRGMLTVGGWTMASRVLGFARDMLIAALLGAGPIADAFFVALKLPNLFRRLFGEGAFNAAFVPASPACWPPRDRQAARQFAAEALRVMTLLAGALTIAGRDLHAADDGGAGARLRGDPGEVRAGGGRCRGSPSPTCC